jgi:hypothetical protein
MQELTDVLYGNTTKSYLPACIYGTLYYYCSKESDNVLQSPSGTESALKFHEITCALRLDEYRLSFGLELAAT